MLNRVRLLVIEHRERGRVQRVDRAEPAQALIEVAIADMFVRAALEHRGHGGKRGKARVGIYGTDLLEQR